MARSEVALLTAPPVAGATCSKLAVDVTANSLYFRELDGTWTQLVVGAGGALTDGDYGDVIVSGGGTVITIANDVVTYAQLQNVSASQRILGRISIGSGNVEELTPAQARTILGVGNAFSRINADSTLVLADSPGDTLNLVPGANIAFVVDPLTDTITITAAGAGGIVDGDKGDIVVGGGGTVWLIDNDVVTYAKIQNVSTNNRILGRITAGAGNVEELTPAQVATIVGSSARKDDTDTLVFAVNLAVDFDAGSYDNKITTATGNLTAPTFTATRKGYYGYSVTQDAVGGWEVTTWPANVVFKGAAEQLDPTPLKTTNFLMYFDGSEFLATRI